MTEFGAQFRAQSRGAIQAAATPPSGNSQENIWYQLYDTQTYVDNSTTDLNFFLSPNADKTLTNMTQAGTLPSPQTLQIYNITCDVLSTIPVTTGAGVVGVLTDLALLLFGRAQRPIWSLSISDKQYGPQSLTVLHGTGGPTGWTSGTTTADNSVQYARNEPSGGWNYQGRVTILEQMNFSLNVKWAAAADVTADKSIRISMFGVLGRRVL